MNFGEVIKEEIFSRPIKDKRYKRAFLAGLIRGNGVIYESEDGLGLSFKVAGETRAMETAEIFKSYFGFEIREIAVEEDRLNHRDLAEFDLTGKDAEKVLTELEIIEEKNGEISVLGLSDGFYKDDEIFRAFLRGTFISAGSCTVPTENSTAKTGYHLELNFSHSQTAGLIVENLSKRGIKSNVLRRKENFVLYLKSAEEIKDFIAFLPAPVSVLKFTDIMVERELFNTINRRKNCDLGNVNRQIEAQEKILKVIEKIEKSGEFSKLKPELKETALKRKKFSGDTLSELAERLKVTKSCLNHRLRKLTEIAEKITEEN